MPPPDLTYTYLTQQQALLRDIRDLLAARTSPGTGGSPSIAASSPSAPWLSMQMAADKTLSASWDTLAWGQAYRHDFKSTLSGDLLGTMGLRPGPSTLHEMEFRAMAADHLSSRLGYLPFDVLSGGLTSAYGSRSRAMASDILAYSGRFARAGDAASGIFGNGINVSAANSLARELQVNAASDLRFSGADYNTIMGGGLRSGQFDFAHSIDDLKQKFTELRDSVAAVTRANKMSVEEATNALGNLRQMGLSSPMQQAHTLTTMGAMARVAGVSLTELMQVGSGAVGSGMAAGLGAATSLGLAGSNLADIREASRAGILSANLMARGGNAASIASAITNAQQGFLGTAAARMAFNGRGGPGGFFGAMNRGMTSAISGGLDSMLAFETQSLGDIGADQAEDLHLSYLRQQMGFMGVTDFTSSRAHDMAYMLTRGQMGDAAALAFANMNFTAEGVAGRMRTRMRTRMDQERNARLSDLDEYYEATSPVARFHRGLGAVSAAVHTGASWVGRMISPGQSGLFGLPGFEGRFENDVRAQAMGISSGVASAEAWANYAGPAAVKPTGEAVLSGLGYRSWGMGIGAAAGAGLGGFLGSFLSPLGTYAGATLGGIGGSYLGGAIGGLFGADTTISGDRLKDYLASYSATQTSVADASKATPALWKSSAFQTLISNFNRAYKTDTDKSLEVQGLLREAAAQAGPGVTQEDVAAAFKGIGGVLEMSKPVGTFGGAKGSDLIKALLKGHMEDTGISAASAEFAGAAADYVQGIRKSDPTMQSAAMAKLQGMGIKGDAMNSFRENAAKIASGRLEDTESALREQANTAMSATANVAFGAFRDDVLSRTERLREGNFSKDFSKWLTGASSEEVRQALFGQGENAAAFRNLLRQSGDQTLMDAGELSSSSLDFAKASGRDIMSRFHMGMGYDKRVEAMQKQGFSTDQIRRVVMADKLGMTPDSGTSTEEKETKMRVDAMQAIVTAMKEMTKRLTGG